MSYEHKDQKSEHRRKMVAPLIFTIVISAYYITIGIVFLCIPEIPFLIKILFAVIPLALAGVAVYVLIERIKEIRSGEEDDLGKY